MITSKTNPKDIKNIQKERFLACIRLKSTPTIIKRESSQGGENNHRAGLKAKRCMMYSLFINVKVFSILLSFLLFYLALFIFTFW